LYNNFFVERSPFLGHPATGVWGASKRGKIKVKIQMSVSGQKGEKPQDIVFSKKIITTY